MRGDIERDSSRETINRERFIARHPIETTAREEAVCFVSDVLGLES